MPETSHCYCLPLQSSKVYRDHSKTLVNSEGCHNYDYEIWGSRRGVNEESSLLGREAAKRLWFSRVYLYISTYVWVKRSDGDMGRCVGALTVLDRGTCGWSRCMWPGSVTLAAGRHQRMWIILLKIQSESCCIFLDVFLSFLSLSLSLILIYTSKSLFSRACLLRNPTQPFLF